MRKLWFLGVVAGILSLASCRSAPPDAGRSVENSAASAQVSGTRYLCEDGSAVEAVYPDVNSARIRYKGQSIEMKLAVSASGARYTGGGWQWWTKGLTEGYLTPLPPGEEIAPTTGITCTVPADHGK